MSYKVKDYMDAFFKTVDINASIREAASIIAGNQVQGFLIVTDKGVPKGVVTSIDIVIKVVAEGRSPEEVKVLEVMTSPLITIDPDEDLLKASELMQKNNVRRLVVEKNGIIYGVLTSSDIARRCGEYVNKATRDLLRWSFPMR